LQSHSISDDRVVQLSDNEAAFDVLDSTVMDALSKELSSQPQYSAIPTFNRLLSAMNRISRSAIMALKFATFSRLVSLNANWHQETTPQGSTFLQICPYQYLSRVGMYSMQIATLIYHFCPSVRP